MIRLDGTIRSIPSVIRIVRGDYKGGVEILSLSKNMGTSIQMIQKHYEHVIMEMKGKDLVKDVDLKETDMLIFD